MRTEYVGEVCLALDAGAQGVDQVADWLWNDPQAKIARCHGYIAHRATVRDVMAAARRELEAIRRPGRREEAMRMMHEYGGPHRLKTCRECEDTVEPGHALCERCEQEEERKMDALVPLRLRDQRHRARERPVKKGNFHLAPGTAVDREELR